MPFPAAAIPIIAAAVPSIIQGITGQGKEKKQKIKPVSTQSKTQKQLTKLINQGLTQGTGPLNDIFGEFNEADFQKGVADPSIKNFKENILPMLQERFISGGFSPAGSGIQRAENRAGVDLQSQLDQLLYNAKQGQKANRVGGVNAILGGHGVENIVNGGSPSATTGALQGLTATLPGLINSYNGSQGTSAPQQGGVSNYSTGPIRAPTQPIGA